MSRAQLYEAGYSKQAVQTRIAGGRLHRIHRGVYAVGHARLSLRGRWMAAVLACGSGARLSHRDAATLHDLRPVGSGAIDVTSRRRHSISGIRSHTSAHPHGTVLDGIPVTTLEQTLLDLAEVLNARRLRSALEQAQRMDVLNLDRIHALVERSPGRHGIKPLTAALGLVGDDEPSWTQSDLERLFLTLARDHGLPAPSTNVPVHGDLVDALWSAHNLIVEVDGWRFHRTRGAFEGDRARDARLITAGFRVLRLTHRRLTDEPAAVAAQLRELLSRPPVPAP